MWCQNESYWGRKILLSLALFPVACDQIWFLNFAFETPEHPDKFAGFLCLYQDGVRWLALCRPRDITRSAKPNIILRNWPWARDWFAATQVYPCFFNMRNCVAPVNKLLSNRIWYLFLFKKKTCFRQNRFHLLDGFEIRTYEWTKRILNIARIIRDQWSPVDLSLHPLPEANYFITRHLIAYEQPIKTMSTCRRRRANARNVSF